MAAGLHAPLGSWDGLIIHEIMNRSCDQGLLACSQVSGAPPLLLPFTSALETWEPLSHYHLSLGGGAESAAFHVSPTQSQFIEMLGRWVNSMHTQQVNREQLENYAMDTECTKAHSPQGAHEPLPDRDSHY